MLLTPQEIKKQTRALWQSVFNDSEEFVQLYFDEKYTDDANVFFRYNGQVLSAMQAFPARFQMGGHVLPSMYLSGLATQPDMRRQGLASQVLYYAHRRAFDRGLVFSFLVPGTEELKDFYRQPIHGDYEVATARKRSPLERTDTAAADMVVSEPDAYGSEVYFFYKKQMQQSPVALTPSENDFFVAVADAEIEGGGLLVARQKQKIVGTCIYVPTAKGHLVTDLLVATPQVQTAFVDFFEQEKRSQSVEVTAFCKWETKGAVPYAMARVINVERFLRTVAAHHPTEVFEVGVEGDSQIPENNGYYRLDCGKLHLIEHRPNVVLTPGAFAAAFLREHEVEMRLLMSDTPE